MYRSIFAALVSLTAAHSVKAIELKEITTKAEYDRVSKGAGPTVIVFSSDTCSLCPQHKEALLKVAANYPGARYYHVNASNEFGKEFRQAEKIGAFPTTHFISKAGKRAERGCMGEGELDSALFELTTGKKKAPVMPPKPTQKAQPAKK